MNKSGKPKFFYGYFIVAAGLLILLVMWGTLFSFGVFFKPLSTEFGWTRAMTSGAFSLCTILHGALAIGVGRLTDRFGPRIVITACGFFLGLGYILMSQISTVWELYLFYGVIVAIGMSAAAVPMMSTAARWFVKRRGMMTGIVLSGVGAGAVIMPPLASHLISTLDWRTSYIIVGSIALIIIISVAQLIKRDPGQVGQLAYGEEEVREQSLNVQTAGLSLRQAIRTRQLWMFCGLYLCQTFSVITIVVHIVPHATDIGISAANAATILAVLGGLGIVGRLIMGSASDRIGNRRMLVICFTMLSVALLWLIQAKELWMLYLFAVVCGFAWGGVATVTSLIVAEFFGLSSHGAILGVVLFAAAIGGASGPTVAGGIFDVTGSYTLAFLICTVVAVIGVILALLLRPINRGRGATDS